MGPTIPILTAQSHSVGTRPVPTQPGGFIRQARTMSANHQEVADALDPIRAAHAHRRPQQLKGLTPTVQHRYASTGTTATGPPPFQASNGEGIRLDPRPEGTDTVTAPIPSVTRKRPTKHIFIEMNAGSATLTSAVIRVGVNAAAPDDPRSGVQTSQTPRR